SRIYLMLRTDTVPRFAIVRRSRTSAKAIDRCGYRQSRRRDTTQPLSDDRSVKWSRRISPIADSLAERDSNSRFRFTFVSLKRPEGRRSFPGHPFTIEDAEIRSRLGRKLRHRGKRRERSSRSKAVASTASVCLPNRSLSTADHRPPEFGRSELIISDELARLRIYLATLHQINASGKRLSRRQSIGGFYIGKGAAPGLDAWRKKSHVSFTRAHVPRRGILNRDRFGGQL